MQLTQSHYGLTGAGEAVRRYTCTNENGYVLVMIDYGATVTSFEAPDKDGIFENITLGCNELAEYEACSAYLGSTVGRFANRIAGAKFSLDNCEYLLAANDGPNHLHGGERGFDKRVWQSEEIARTNEVGVRFSLSSADGDEGYPGNLNAQAEYTLNNDNELKIEFSATTDRATPVNLTNHCYWNLTGNFLSEVLSHQIRIAASEYLTLDRFSIPKQISRVDASPFDFRDSTSIGQRIGHLDSDPGGYDHCFVLDSLRFSDHHSRNDELKLAAQVSDPESGRCLTVLTDQPGIQFYTGNYLNGQPASGGFEKHRGFCLETQGFPDAVNRPDFPSTILRSGAKYRHFTVFQFSVRD